ncbi:Di-copper centre-containing protein [Apiospora rasikravindrae]|uniref:Di-copper centre-containing protein n=1 Tax=Apiospora rasikravindrae TaxID=990691 RepID=A0ABR1SF22_9PEZI
MKLTTAICGGITAASAMTLPLNLPHDFPGRIFQAAASAPALPLSAFPKFETVKLQDAKKAAPAYSKVASAGGAEVADAAASTDNTNANANNDNGTVSIQQSKAAKCGTPSPRVEWSAYPASSKRAFVDAIACLQSKPASGNFAPATNRYEDFVRLHQAWTPNIHNNDLFLIWHRYFVWTFEQALRKECGFAVAGLPWWDETRDAGRFAASPVFTAEYFGSLPKANGAAGTCITNGRFAGTTLHIGPGGDHQPHCLSRAVDESGTAQVNKDYENACLSRSTYTDFAQCWEKGPHGIGHNSIGSVMADVLSSPGDPVFWMHHLYVDRVFSSWQDRDASGARKRTVNGCADGAKPCTPLTRQTLVPMAGLLKDVTVGEVLDTVNGATCYVYK